MTWIHEGKEFTLDPTEKYWGFVYLIHNTQTDRFYVGKKFFTKSKIRQVKGRKKKSRVDSDWQNYWGSSATVLADVAQYGEQAFTRTILHLCRSKAECSFWESYEIFVRKALISRKYYNDWISCRVRKAHLHSLLS
jgi:hypothetical protein